MSLIYIFNSLQLIIIKMSLFFINDSPLTPIDVLYVQTNYCRYQQPFYFYLQLMQELCFFGTRHLRWVNICATRLIKSHSILVLVFRTNDDITGSDFGICTIPLDLCIHIL